MPVEPFNRKRRIICWILASFFTLIPLVVVVVGVYLFYSGPSRATYIKQYNERAAYWRDSGLEVFRSNSFSIRSPIATEPFRVVSRKGINQYPVEDACDKKGDPYEGCIYVDSAWFDSTVIVYDSEARYSIYDSNMMEIASFSYPGTVKSMLTPKDLDCSKRISDCESICIHQNGVWNSSLASCLRLLYISNTCHRLSWKDGHYSINTSQKLPENKQYRVLKSDYGGCEFSTNWNSAIYSDKKVNQIHVFLKSAEDAVIAASAQTRGCSDSRYPNNCFGKIRMEEKVVAFTMILCAVLVLGIEVLTWIVFRVVVSFKEQQAKIKAMNQSFEQDIYLLNWSVSFSNFIV